MKAPEALRRIGILLTVAGLAFLIVFAVRHAADLPPIRWNALTISAFLAALGLYVLTLLSSAVAWHLLLLSLGERSRLNAAVPVFLVSQAAKYLPGNVGQYVGRIGLGRSAGLTAGGLVLSLILEAAGAVLAGTALATAALPSAGVPAPWRFAATALGAGAVVALASLASGRLGLPPVAPGRRIAAWLAGTGLYGLNFVLFAMAAALLVRGPLASSAVPLAQLAAVFAAAWVAGFVTPGAPAGLGVREAVLVGGLQPLCGPGVALGLPIVFRLLTTLGDGLGFAAGMLLRPRRAPEVQDAAESDQ
jgi:glycosyltransferase 2 family protein